MPVVVGPRLTSQLLGVGRPRGRVQEQPPHAVWPSVVIPVGLAVFELSFLGSLRKRGVVVGVMPRRVREVGRAGSQDPRAVA